MRSVREFARPLTRRLRRPVEAFRHPGNRGHRVRAVLRALRFLARGLVGRTTIVPLGHSSRVVADARETNSPKAVVNAIPDRPEMLVWMKRLGKGDLFVDVGANVGLYSIVAAEAGADVIAIEADRGTAERLRENLRLNGYGAEIVEKAVSDRSGSGRLTTGLDSYNHLVLDDSPGLSIATTTLDEVIGKRTVAGMKIDVQGAEMLVLQGARTLLQEQRIRCLQMEWNGLSTELLGEPRSMIANLLQGFGYVMHRAEESGDLRPAHDDIAEGRRDMFALPRPSLGGG